MRVVRLSIVTPTRHSPHLIDRLYNSLIGQTCAEFEHILVDTSVDNRTQERWWRDFAPHLDHRFRYARVHLYRPELAAAFEHAFTVASGEYVCPMTHKAMWRPDAVENIHKILNRFPEIHSFAFKSLYTPVDFHTHEGDFRDMRQFLFGSAWDGSEPLIYKSQDVFLESAALFGRYGYHGPHIEAHYKCPSSSHALFSRKILDRVRERFGSVVAGKFAGDSRAGYRIMDLEGEVYHFPNFEPRVSSTHVITGAAGASIRSWPYLCRAFETLSAETKQQISRSPFGYLPLWEVMNCWELFSIVDEARQNLAVQIEFDASVMMRNLVAEVQGLSDIEEPVRAGILRHCEAIAARCKGGVVRKWF